MGGQGVKHFPIKRYSKYKTKIDTALEREDIADAAKTVAPLIGMVTGHQEVAAGICAIADAYLSYKKDQDLPKAVYEGAKTFIKETTPGLIAGQSISAIEQSSGIKLNSGTKEALTYALESGISKTEDKIFNKIEEK